MEYSYAEQAKTKCIGITIETRPDYCLKPHLRSVAASTRGDRKLTLCPHSSMLRYGCTRLEVRGRVFPPHRVR